jgi:histidinol-phosphate aminotransferase
MLESHPYLHPLPSQGNFILTEVDIEEVKLERIRRAVEERGVMLRFFNHPYLSNFVRLTVGLPEHTDLIACALDQIRAEV